VNQIQKKDYIRRQLRKDTSTIYEKSMQFLQFTVKRQHWTARKGLYLLKKIAYTRLSLSLSLSPPLEERVRGEVGGSWTLIRSNHPTAIFGQRVPYLAGVQIVFSSQRMLSIEKVFISEFIMAIHDFQNNSKSAPGGRPSGTAPVAETGAVPAP